MLTQHFAETGMSSQCHLYYHLEETMVRNHYLTSTITPQESNTKYGMSKF